MKNIERQNRLDQKKWIASEKNGNDLSGEMMQCHYCENQTPNGFQSDGYYKHGCDATQEERETACLCAKAYNKMHKKGDRK